MRVGIVAGEASGNLLGAGFLNTLKERIPTVQSSGIGGTDMMASGCHSLYDIERLSVMGLIEPLSRLPELIKIRRNLYRHFTQLKPDVFIGIDSPDFNLGLERKLKENKIPVVHYVSPSVWAWRKRRIKKISQAVDLVLTLFPFEADFYAEHDVKAHFVGHPLADLIPLDPDKNAARDALHLDKESLYIALLPGSRGNELKYLAETFIQTALQCHKENPEIKFITSAANEIRNKEFQDICKKLGARLPILFFERRSHDVMAAADAVLVASGTATLETLLFKRPMVIAYRMANLTFQIAKRLVTIPHVGLPNVLAKKLIVPEYIQDDAKPETMARDLLEFLYDADKAKSLQNKFLEIHQTLRCNANAEAVNAVLKLVNR